MGMVCMIKQDILFSELHSHTSRYFLGDYRSLHSDKGFWRNDLFPTFNTS